MRHLAHAVGRPIYALRRSRSKAWNSRFPGVVLNEDPKRGERDHEKDQTLNYCRDDVFGRGKTRPRVTRVMNQGNT